MQNYAKLVNSLDLCLALEALAHLSNKQTTVLDFLNLKTLV